MVLSVAFGNSAWNMYNEYHDRDVDAISKPRKPFPSKLVDEKVVHLLITLFLGISYLLIILLVEYGLIYVLGFLGNAASYVYNGVRRDIVGNLFMSLAYSVAAFMSLYPSFLLFIPIFFLLTLSFNLLVQWQDIPSEEVMGIRTAPMQLGKLTPYLVIILSASIMLMLPTLQMPFYSEMAFVSTCVSLIAGTGGIFFDKRYLVELFCRILARILLIMGFALMLLHL